MRERIIIDTNLLILLVVGSYDPAYIEKHKNTSDYTIDDYELLLMRLEGCDLVVTSSILTEVSNLLWQTSDPHKTNIRLFLSQFIATASEHSPSSVGVTNAAEFMSLGLTDAGILELPAGSGLILTVDLDLHVMALCRELPTENFNNFRFT